VLSMVLTVVICLAFLAGFLALTDWISVRALRYRLDENGFSFVGLLRRKTIPYWQIESVRSLSWRDFLLDISTYAHFYVHWYNNRVLTRTFVALRQRDGKVLMCSPDDPDGFVRFITERIAGTAPPKLPDHEVLTDPVSLTELPPNRLRR